MTICVGHIPYLNMVPFHQDFGPRRGDSATGLFEFRSLSPRSLGVEAERGMIDAGALSLVDGLRLANHFEPVGAFGIGLQKAAQSVLLFSKVPMNEFSGFIAVTDETSTSVQLLQVLLEKRYQRTGLSLGRIASATLYDGSADALLLIGDEALRAQKDGIKGLPVVTDLGLEWFDWQGKPFVFARWMVRKSLAQDVKNHIGMALERSLSLYDLRHKGLAQEQGLRVGWDAEKVEAYWKGFSFRLSADHLNSIGRFEELAGIRCSI